MPLHPRDALFDPEERSLPALPVCDHYAGVEPRMSKSLQLQAELGPVFDVTLDNEDGAPAGREVEHARLIASLLGGPLNRFGRVGVRLLPVDHPAFGDVAAVVLAAARRPAYLTIPKVRGLDCIERAAHTRRSLGDPSRTRHAALAQVQALAAHPRIECLSFGLMDFVSAHRGAIPQWAMSADGQFDHPLVVRAKLEIAAACHAHGKVPSHGVVTEFQDSAALAEAARKAAELLGYTRMWSIHPAQVRTIVAAFSPTADEVAQAVAILRAAEAADWAPIRHTSGGAETLHDRASYRYFWQVLQRAERLPAGRPPEVRRDWVATGERA